MLLLATVAREARLHEVKLTAPIRAATARSSALRDWADVASIQFEWEF